MAKVLGEGTVALTRPVYIGGYAAAVGKKEKQGPLGAYFEIAASDAYWGEKSFELAERKLYLTACRQATARAGLGQGQPDVMLGGDLLNQIVTSSYAARELELPFLGLYGACSAITQSIAVGSLLIDGGGARTALCAAGSHFGSAERQFRSPLELGTPKPPTAQDTVTGAGAVLLTETPGRMAVRAVTVGRCVDFGITDANDMGAAMAPAAAQSILTHLEQRGAAPSDYDAIFTGDLGTFGSSLFLELAAQCGADLSKVHQDCGCLIFGPQRNCGASGCGCCASVLGGYILKRMEQGVYRRVLVAATGALLSTTIVQQGESIPGIAHVIELERME